MSDQTEQCVAEATSFQRRSKPVTAIRFDGSPAGGRAVSAFVGRRLAEDWGDALPQNNPVWLWLGQHEYDGPRYVDWNDQAGVKVHSGDWVVRHADGEIERMSAAQFHDEYVRGPDPMPSNTDGSQ